MEGIAAVGVVVARATVVVDDVVVGVAQHVRPILSLLQASCFCHLSAVCSK